MSSAGPVTLAGWLMTMSIALVDVYPSRSTIAQHKEVLEERLQQLQDAHRCSVCYAAPRNALVWSQNPQ